jgi:hypothetical protein
VSDNPQVVGDVPSGLIGEYGQVPVAGNCNRETIEELRIVSVSARGVVGVKALPVAAKM